MIRFANPGSDIDSFIRIFLEVYQALSAQGTFDLDDISQTLVNRNLATSSGYMGEEALTRSTRPDRSRDPLYNQSKMYSELFKLLGWIHPRPDAALRFEFTLLGAHVVAANRDPRALLVQCILGIVYPNPILGSQGNYSLRPFLTILRTMRDLDGALCRDEMIVGPMSLENDRDAALYSAMLGQLRKVRGQWGALGDRLHTLSGQRGISVNTMWNYTRFPIAVLKWSSWAESERDSRLYGKPLVFLRLTPSGESLLRAVEVQLDIRHPDLDGLEDDLVAAIARVGFYQLLARAGFDTHPIDEQLGQDLAKVRLWSGIQHPDILYSPAQDLPPQMFSRVLPLQLDLAQPERKQDSAVPPGTAHPSGGPLGRVNLVWTGPHATRSAEGELSALLARACKESGDPASAADSIAAGWAQASQTDFYPLVAALFRLLGYDCEHSRPGVNYQRWDALIRDPTRSVPIEIKSPTEEEYLSPKSVRQALENKIILLSRRQVPTTTAATSLVVGYRLPNDRSDVNMLIEDIHDAFAVRIGVIDIRSLIRMAIAETVEGQKHDSNALMNLYGMIDVQDPTSTRA